RLVELQRVVLARTLLGVACGTLLLDLDEELPSGPLRGNRGLGHHAQVALTRERRREDRCQVARMVGHLVESRIEAAARGLDEVRLRRDKRSIVSRLLCPSRQPSAVHPTSPDLVSHLTSVAQQATEGTDDG